MPCEALSPELFAILAERGAAGASVRPSPQGALPCGSKETPLWTLPVLWTDDVALPDVMGVLDSPLVPDSPFVDDGRGVVSAGSSSDVSALLLDVTDSTSSSSGAMSLLPSELVSWSRPLSFPSPSTEGFDMLGYPS